MQHVPLSPVAQPFDPTVQLGSLPRPFHLNFQIGAAGNAPTMANESSEDVSIRGSNGRRAPHERSQNQASQDATVDVVASHELFGVGNRPHATVQETNKGKRFRAPR